MGTPTKLETFDSESKESELDSHERLSPAYLQPDERLSDGRFRILERLGRGSTGIVYRAFDRQRAEEMAVKVLYETEGESLAHLKSEFRVMKGLNHPGILEIYELHLNQSPPFFSMQIAKGQPIDLALKHSSSPYVICQRLADALDYLHSHQRIHRDLKPANILVRGGNEVIILDFGFSVNLNETGRYALRAGTPDYMAPEVSKGKRATAAADVYAVGRIIYQGLTGHLPSESAAFATSAQGLSLSEDFSEIVDKMLYEDPEKRPAMLEVSELCQRLANRGNTRRIQEIDSNKRSQFIGRAEELTRIKRALNESEIKRTIQLVHLEGTPGMGKSRLLDEFEKQSPDALIFRSTCFENEQIANKLLDGLIDQLKEYLSGRDDRQVLKLISPEDIGALVRLFPEFGTITAFYQKTKSISEDKSVVQLRRLGEQAFARLLIGISKKRTLVVIFDDVQWGDTESAQALNRIFGPLFSQPALLIFSYRSDATSSSECLSELLEGAATLEDSYDCHKISMQPLERAVALELFNTNQKVSLSQAQSEEVLKAARGSPLMLLEFAAEFRRGAKQQLNVQEIVGTRLESLSSSSRKTFELLCCSPAPLSNRLVFKLLNIEFEVYSEPVRRELQAFNLVRFRSGGLDLEVSHDLFRRATLDLMGSKVIGYHKSLALHFKGTEETQARAALHFKAASYAEESSICSEKAAVQAENKLAFLQAARLYEEALATEALQSDRALRLRLAMAEAYGNAGYPHQAATSFIEISTICPEEQALSTRALAAEQWMMGGQLELGERYLISALKAAGLKWPKTKLEVLVQLFLNRLLNAFHERFARPKKKESSEKEVISFARKLHALNLTNIISYVSTLHGVANNALYLRVATLSGNKRHQGIALGMESVYRAAAGSKEKQSVQAFYDRAQSLLEPKDSDFTQGFLAYVRGQGHYLLHDYQAACQDYQIAESALSRHGRGINFQLTSSRILWASALTYCGRNREFFRRTTQWAEDAQSRGDLYGEVAFRIQLARTDSLRHLDRARLNRELQELLSRWKSSHFSLHDSLARYAQISLDLALEQPKDALTKLALLAKDAQFSFSKVQSARIFHAQQRAKAHLQIASISKGHLRSSQEYLAFQQCRKLHREKSTWATLLATQIEACISLGKNRRDEEALKSLRDICDKYKEKGLHLYVAAVSSQLLTHDQIQYREQHQGRLIAALNHADFHDLKTILNLYAPRIASNDAKE